MSVPSPTSLLKNPYTPRGTVTDPDMFFGRKDELDYVFERLRGCQSISVVGPQSIGKSSLLRYICKREVYERHLSAVDKWCFVFLDLHSLGQPTKQQFFELVLEELEQVTNKQMGHFSADYDGFRSFVDVAHAAGWKLVLCLDGFDILGGRNEFDNDFFYFMRAMAGQHGNLAYVTASWTNLYNICHLSDAVGSGLWTAFVQQDLGLLESGAARDLVLLPHESQGLKVYEAELESMLRLAGRHPLFLQILCFHLFKAKANQKSSGSVDFDTLKKEFQREAGPYFGHIWRQLSDEEKHLVQKIRKQGEMPKEDALLSTQLSARSIIITSGGEYEPFSQGFAEFIDMTPPVEPAGEAVVVGPPVQEPQGAPKDEPQHSEPVKLFYGVGAALVIVVTVTAILVWAARQAPEQFPFIASVAIVSTIVVTGFVMAYIGVFEGGQLLQLLQDVLKGKKAEEKE